MTNLLYETGIIIVRQVAAHRHVRAVREQCKNPRMTDNEIEKLLTTLKGGD